MAQVCDQPGQLCGGTGHVKRSNKEVQKICDEVKLQVEEKAGKKFDVFKATAFSTQSVAGTNYFIKVQVGEKDYIHLRVFSQEYCDSRKTKGNKTKKKKTSFIKTAKTIKEQLDPAGIINPSRKSSRAMDLAKLTEEGIVNEHVRLSTQLMNWLNKVADVGKGIANGVCRTVNLI
ncbi:hypothetical protein KOW79_022268 [Hemibagrus wyckioides]|uniref:Cystatin-B n=1 Tax=Hemibagrus wyckioides TaxID=337641 RepID=A0A9D3N3M7_9TELE|nr:hypothetical protein KOW79_022268 [Hemibagrus wyckioides]